MFYKERIRAWKQENDGKIPLFQHDRMINIRLCILTGTGSFQEAPTIDGLKITTGNSSLFWYSRYSAMALV